MDVANTWTDERVELLKKLWASGKSASQIAGQIGGSVTRNAVIGKVHRLGLSGRGKTKAPAAARPRRAATPTTTKTQTVLETLRATGPRMVAAPVALPEIEKPEPMEVAIHEVAIPPSARVALVDLRESSCRWPIGDPMTADFGFCGAQSVPALPYCQHHCQIAYQAVVDRRKERKAS